jgi:hypothetical protein
MKAGKNCPDRNHVEKGFVRVAECVCVHCKLQKVYDCLLYERKAWVRNSVACSVLGKIHVMMVVILSLT